MAEKEPICPVCLNPLVFVKSHLTLDLYIMKIYKCESCGVKLGIKEEK